MASKKKNVSGFKAETIARIVAALQALISFYMGVLAAGKKLAIVISHGNRKIGRCMNVSLAPIITCHNCGQCKNFCYDVKACCQYENVRKARAKNTAIFLHDREDFFNQLWKKMARKKRNLFLRFHVSGEIVDLNHFEYIVETARRFPAFKIWTYTKMYSIVNTWLDNNGGLAALPENLSVMFSEWKGLPMYNPYNLPVFRCAFSEEDKIGFHCPGCCDFCKEHNCGCVNRQSAWVDLH